MTVIGIGIGPHRALTLIREHKTIEEVLKHLDKNKYPIPDDWPYQAARELFKAPEVTPADSLDVCWTCVEWID